MDFGFLVKGAILGFSIAAPVGPIGILCIRKTMQYGRFSGLFSGLGAAAADSIYAVIAAFGLTFVSQLLLAGQFWLQLIGGGFLIYLGGKTFFSKTVAFSEGRLSHKTLITDFVSTFFLTMTNPLTILSFLAVFAGLGLSSKSSNYGDAILLVLGVFLGSAAWWLILSEGVTFFRKKMTAKAMTWINRLAGVLITGFGLFAWLTLLPNS